MDGWAASFRFASKVFRFEEIDRLVLVTGEVILEGCVISEVKYFEMLIGRIGLNCIDVVQCCNFLKGDIKLGYISAQSRVRVSFLYSKCFVLVSAILFLYYNSKRNEFRKLLLFFFFGNKIISL